MSLGGWGGWRCLIDRARLVKDTNASDPGTWLDLFLVPVGKGEKVFSVSAPGKTGYPPAGEWHSTHFLTLHKHQFTMNQILDA